MNKKNINLAIKTLKLLENNTLDKINFEKNFKEDIKPWNKGKKILVLPPTNAIANFFGVENWLQDTLDTLKKCTDRQIDVREKPYNPTVEKDHVGATVKVERPTERKGKINWPEYYAMVTYNSNEHIRKLFDGHTMQEWDLTYTMRSTGSYNLDQSKRKELLITNYEQAQLPFN